MPSLPSRALVPHVPPVQDAGAAGRTGRKEKGAVEENGVTDDMRADPCQTGAQTPGTSVRVPPQAPVPSEPQEAADPQTGFAGAGRAGLSGVGGPPSRPYLVTPRRAASGGGPPVWGYGCDVHFWGRPGLSAYTPPLPVTPSPLGGGGRPQRQCPGHALSPHGRLHAARVRGQPCPAHLAWATCSET